MTHEFKVDISKALAMIDIVKHWGEWPEIKKDLAPARKGAVNSLMALILTGTQVGAFPNNPEFNQLLLDKLAIAFDMGYYSHSMKASGD
jgi:hypothetical protein